MMQHFRPLVIVVLVLAGCASRHVPASSARLTEHEALQIAVVVAQKAGNHLDEYKTPHTAFDANKKQWRVFWDRKLGNPGGYIFVSVDDKSGVGTLIPSD